VTAATALLLATIAVALGGAPAVSMVIVGQRGVRAADRGPLRLVAGGIALIMTGAITAAASVGIGRAAVPRWSVAVLGLAAGTGAILFAAALIRPIDGAVGQKPAGRRSPVRAAIRPAALRRWADGVLIGASAAYVLWAVLVGPAEFGYLGRPATETVKAVALVLYAPLLVAAGACVALGFRGWRQRPDPAAAVIVIEVVLGGVLLAVAGLGQPGLTVAAGVAVAACLPCVAAVACRPAMPRPAGPSNPYAIWLALVPVSLAVVSWGVRLAIHHRSDNTATALAVVIGAALGWRHLLAFRDLRAHATEVASREQRFRRLAHTDPLTGLGNRRFFRTELEERAGRGEPTTLMCVDLDRFKAINDVWGHDVGDALLIEVGRRLRRHLRTGDVAARLGGDEFAVLVALPPLAAREAAQRLAAALAKPYELGGRCFALSASVGLAGYAGHELDDLMRQADMALRFAKMRGRRRVEDYESAYHHWLRRRMAIEDGLPGALARDEMTLAYQPVFSLPTGNAVGVEALLRWRHPTLGPVGPAEFVPIAEDCGLGEDLARWVLREAGRRLSRWLADGHDVWVSADIPVRQVRRTDFSRWVAETLRMQHVPPGHLIVEVDEHQAAVEAADIAERLGAVRSAGARVALDSVGAGLSVLGRLRDVPVDVLKISQSLFAEEGVALDDASPVSGLRYTVPEPRPRGHPAARSAVPLVDAIVRVGSCLDLDVIALGVADERVRRLVDDAGCRLAQGPALGEPMAAEEIDALLAAPVPAADGRCSLIETPPTARRGNRR
jgi:diguanylate cyclase (GGDEF)-like protein